MLVTVFPKSEALDKSIALFDRFNGAQCEQQAAQFPARFGRGITSQPTATFVLDVVEAALENGVGPNQSQGSQNGYFSVGGHGRGTKPLSLQFHEPWTDGFEPFLGHIEVGNNQRLLRAHQTHQAPVLVKISAVQNQILESMKLIHRRRNLRKPVILDP